MSIDPVDPLSVICEILGEPAADMRNPVNAGYECPFINSQCVKRSQKIAGPYPICSVWTSRTSSEPKLTCVCPKRFYEINFIDDVVKTCWPGTAPLNPRIVHDVNLKEFGNVDFVIADIDPAEGDVREFVSVSMQAVDLIGSVEPAYHAVTNSEPYITGKINYNVNWANVRKRFISQLIAKGFYHQNWGTRIIAVVQEATYNHFQQHLKFDEYVADSDQAAVVFMLYDFKKNEGDSPGYSLILKRAVGTTPESLMNSSRREMFPPKSKMAERITARILL